MLVFYFQVSYENTEGYGTAPFFHGLRDTVLTLPGTPLVPDRITCSPLCLLAYGNIARKREYQSFGGLVSLTDSVVGCNKL